MHIKDIILDGFKCYENPTVLRNLDKSYNAITGLNGSGKSNVIDAIVFTLNLESKKLLRANTLKDLINTHRKDCKVTLVLSNKDKSKSPPGYKDYNEIIISRSLDSQGKSKFSINNHICTSTTISKFCSSIGIHSEKNSPFIVMQGHITKVLNMKSKEIGTLIEETAGTRSYTKEKEKALQVLEKKEIKLKGVRDSMERRISPFYERLSQERVAFIEQKTAEENKIKSQKEIKKCKDLLKKSEIKLKEIEKKIINLEKEDYAHENLKLKNELEEEEDKLRRVEIDCREEGEGDVECEGECEVEDGSKVGVVNDKVDGKDEKDNNNTYNNTPLALLKEKEKIILENLRSNGNLFGDSNKIKNKEELTILENKKLEEEIKLKEKSKCNKWGKEGYNLDKDYKEVYNQDNDHNNYEIWLDKNINFLNNLKINEEDLKFKINKLDFLKSKINYPFIEGVYGSVGENIKIKDKKYLEAINTILGNKIKHIIVENEVIGGDLLKKADRRISVIPLNKIIIKKNLEIKGLVRALDLVDFDLNLKKAIEYVLGNIFVFENKEEARRSCFEFGILCVTLEGIIYDPKGTVTGGKSIGKIEIVTKKEIEDLENEILKMKKNKNEFEKNKKNYEKFLKEKNEILEKKKIKENIKILNLKIETLKKMIKNDFNKKDLENLRKEIIKKTIEEKKRGEEDERRLERIKEREKEREMMKIKIKERDQILIKIKEIKEKIKENQKKNVNKKEDEDLENKQKNLIREVLRKKNKIKKIYEVKIGDLEGGEGVGEGEVGGGEDKGLGEDKDEMEEYEDKGEVEDKGLGEDMDEMNEYEDTTPLPSLPPLITPNNPLPLLDLDFINPKIFNFKILNLSQDQENQIYQSLQKSRDALKSLNSRKSSIRMDPSNFNLLEKYDHDISTLKEKINKIEKDKEKILKSITNFDSLGIKEMEKAFKHINKKLGVLLRYFLPDSDAKIVKNGESGGSKGEDGSKGDVGDDGSKGANKGLSKGMGKGSNKDKGKDVSSKDNGDKDITTSTNYELKVKIGNWKDSLLELSGGQRSLVALCLIFSMLTYKPAPFYIFDEIDAALDLNYTQSIGEIIKKEFDSAQFIVISLKNGMYDNANSVFKVFIKNGKSAIAQIK